MEKQKKMERPTRENKKKKPIFIFENGIKIHQASDIKQTNIWFKEYIGSNENVFPIIMGGAFLNRRWIDTKTGKKYRFTTDREYQLKKLKDLFKKFSGENDLVKIWNKKYSLFELNQIYNEVENENRITTSKNLNIDILNTVKEVTNIKKKLNNKEEIEELSFSKELDTLDTYLEGAQKQITVNAYERNPKAREECLSQKGYQCSVCNFDFVSMYGELGKGYIHVHHLLELSLIGTEYQVSAKDLAPVCPNCHAMLHKKKPAYSIEELQEIIRLNRIL